jgi:hypothetical protein
LDEAIATMRELAAAAEEQDEGTVASLMDKLRAVSVVPAALADAIAVALGMAQLIG